MFIFMFLLSQTEIVHDVGWLWNTETNRGTWGGVPASMSWPGWWTGGNNYYLWAGGLWIGAVSAGETLVTQGMDESEWWPGSLYLDTTAPKSEQDIVATYSDLLNNSFNPPGRHLGLSVFQRGLGWAQETYRSQLAYELYISYDKA